MTRSAWAVILLAAASGCRHVPPPTDPFLRTTVPPPATTQFAAPGAVDSYSGTTRGTGPSPSSGVSGSGSAATPPSAGTAPPTYQIPPKDKFAPAGGFHYQQGAVERPPANGTLTANLTARIDPEVDQLLDGPGEAARAAPANTLATAGPDSAHSAEPWAETDETSEAAESAGPSSGESLLAETTTGGIDTAATLGESAELVAFEYTADRREAEITGEPEPANVQGAWPARPTLRILAASSDDTSPSHDESSEASVSSRSGEETLSASVVVAETPPMSPRAETWESPTESGAQVQVDRPAKATTRLVVRTASDTSFADTDRTSPDSALKDSIEGRHVRLAAHFSGSTADGQPTEQRAQAWTSSAPASHSRTDQAPANWQPLTSVGPPSASDTNPTVLEAVSPGVRRFGFNPGYESLRGRLEYSHSRRQWKLRYIPVDGQTDAYGGSVVIANPGLLEGAQPGDLVEVHGTVIGDATPGRGFSPGYQLTAATRLSAAE